MTKIDNPSQTFPSNEKQENHLIEVARVFLRLGFTAFGGPAAHIAMMREEVVRRRRWISDERFVDLLGITNLIPGPSSTEMAIYLGYLLDAISIGQFTPGPVFTTATFIGYVLGGWPGALLATLGIFLPSFVFVALIHPLAARLRSSPWTAPLLDGVNIAALALMAGVLFQLGQ